MSDNPLVYSTDNGRLSPKQTSSPLTKGDGVVRIRRETKGRKGKGVTTISGLMLSADELKKLASELKKVCGTGGAIKDNVIEIQGDSRDKIKFFLEKRNFIVKLAGG